MTQNIDLLALIRHYTNVPDRKYSTNDGEYKAACPLPGCSSDDNALCIWPDHPSGEPQWWCRKCKRTGDAIAWLVLTGDLDTMGAAYARQPFDITDGGKPAADPVAWLVEKGHVSAYAAGLLFPGGAIPATCEKTAKTRNVPAMPKPPAPTVAPGPEWQQAARAFVETCRAALWADGGHRALAWLRGRGLSDDTIRAAGLGYNPQGQHQARESWGMDGDNPIWLDRGIVIPWEIGGEIWRVNIRRPAGEPKYRGPAGFANGLYNADALGRDKPALLVEGEIDALTVNQVAGDLVTAVALGSTDGARRLPWVAALAACHAVLVALDADGAGDKAASWWLDTLPNARRWRPWWADANQMHMDGVDLRDWLLPALDGDKPDLAARLDALGARIAGAGRRLDALEGNGGENLDGGGDSGPGGRPGGRQGGDCHEIAQKVRGNGVSAAVGAVQGGLPVSLNQWADVRDRAGIAPGAAVLGFAWRGAAAEGGEL